MATTSPDSLRSPNPTDPYNLVADWAITTTDVQNALTRRANLYVGTSAQRTAFTTAPEGTHWQDTNGTRGEYVRESGAWVGGDTGWVNCTLASGVSMQGSSLPQVRRIGKVVYLKWGVSGTGFTAVVNRQAFTIPVGFRPVGGGIYATIAANSAAAAATTEINTSGQVFVRTASTVGTYYIWDGITYLID